MLTLSGGINPIAIENTNSSACCDGVAFDPTPMSDRDLLFPIHNRALGPTKRCYIADRGNTVYTLYKHPYLNKLLVKLYLVMKIRHCAYIETFKYFRLFYNFRINRRIASPHRQISLSFLNAKHYTRAIANTLNGVTAGQITRHNSTPK